MHITFGAYLIYVCFPAWKYIFNCVEEIVHLLLYKCNFLSGYIYNGKSLINYGKYNFAH